MLFELARSRHNIWMSVFIYTDFVDTDNAWAPYRDKITAAVSELGI